MVESRIRIVGTSHISKESVRTIKKVFKEFEPDIIAVELDKRRLLSLSDRQQGKNQMPSLSLARQIGLFGYAFMVIGSYVQRKLAGVVKVQPGVDMLAAVELAKKEKLPLVLADRDILVTMRRLSKGFRWRERMRMVWDVVASPFTQNKLKFDIRKVPEQEIITKLMGIMKERYPGLYKVLLSERNAYMAGKVRIVMAQQPEKKIMLVVGAGHEEGLRKLLANL